MSRSDNNGNGPQRQAQVRERFGPLIGQLVARAKDQGKLRPDIVALDVPLIQLMLEALTDHLGEPEIWRRYLVLLLDGMRARADLQLLPELLAVQLGQSESGTVGTARR
jgi:hypothetical protein